MSMEESTCGICLEECDETIYDGLLCKHKDYFHERCITQWLHTTKLLLCPICRGKAENPLLTTFLKELEATPDRDWICYKKNVFEFLSETQILECERLVQYVWRMRHTIPNYLVWELISNMIVRSMENRKAFLYITGDVVDILSMLVRSFMEEIDLHDLNNLLVIIWSISEFEGVGEYLGNINPIGTKVFFMLSRDYYITEPSVLSASIDLLKAILTHDPRLDKDAVLKEIVRITLENSTTALVTDSCWRLIHHQNVKLSKIYVEAIAEMITCSKSYLSIESAYRMLLSGEEHYDNEVKKAIEEEDMFFSIYEDLDDPEVSLQAFKTLSLFYKLQLKIPEITKDDIDYIFELMQEYSEEDYFCKEVLELAWNMYLHHGASASMKRHLIKWLQDCLVDPQFRNCTQLSEIYTALVSKKPVSEG